MKEKTENMLRGASIALAILCLITTIGSYFVELKHDKTDYAERLSYIEEIAKTKAYDTGDTTDMWWAVVEIAGGGK